MSGSFLLLLLFAACAPAIRSDAVPAPADPEIVGLAMAENEGEIATSEIAAASASAPAVRDFAQRMVAEHSAANDRLARLGITPLTSEASREIAGRAIETAGVLEGFAGATLDRGYMHAQYDLHQHALATLDRHLIPSASAGALRAELRSLRSIVAEHLAEAAALRETM